MDSSKSPSAFIKSERDDHFDFNQSQHFSNDHHQRFDMSQPQNFNAFGSQQPSDNIDPSELTMQSGSVPAQNGNFINSMNSYPSFGSSSNLALMAIGDDELLDLPPSMDGNNTNSGYPNAPYNQPDHGQASMGQLFTGQDHPGSIQMSQPSQMNQVYSQTPEGAPIQSPFVQNFNYDQFRPLPSNHHQFGQPLDGSLNTSPRVRTDMVNGSFENGFAPAKPRSKIHSGLEGRTSQSRSPMTPKTPAMGSGALGLGTPDSGSLPSQPIHTNHLAHHRHQKSLSNQWDSNPNSLHSYVDSPLSSPSQPSNHAQISDILASGKHASLPAKVENGHPHLAGASASGFQTQEAKRRRRRMSHNMVERRRRDNINERIQELSHLVPQHRLEDEKIRKHIMNNSPLSPSLVGSAGPGMSPPQATSLLAGGSGRRAAGTITTGIPIEEKDKGPNKGDTLNGAVTWTRDLMWLLYTKLQQEAQLADYITSLQGSFPFEPTEDEARMRTEILDAMQKNGVDNFSYSRGVGSGLRVPKHTNWAGDALNSARNSTIDPTQSSLQATLSPSMSPAAQSSGGSAGAGQTVHWSGHHSGGSGQGSISFKEEDEYGMDLN
ncbi:MAG: hypothetical protein M1814_002380 [Vezdaea aestivalis]|nr:MAG: hypothetical protein M1814_002380 [Vezdaea aestivalis]